MALSLWRWLESLSLSPLFLKAEGNTGAISEVFPSFKSEDSLMDQHLNTD